MPEQERWKEEELWETISVAENIEFTVDDDYVSRVKENLGETLATRYIDYTRIKEMAQQAKELRLIPEYTENYFKKAFTRAGGRFKEKGKGFLSIEGIPYDIRKLGDEEDFKKGFGTVLKRYPKITFDKELAFKTPDAEFVSFGHPLFEAILIWVETTLMDSINNGAVFYDPDRSFDGYIIFYEGEIKDGTGTIAGKRLFSFYDNGKEVTPVTPSVVWDLIEGEINQVGEPVDFSELKKRVTYKAITKLEEYKEELLKERNRQAEIKEKYGIKSLEHLIIKLDHELIGLYERKEAQENVDIAIRNKGEKKADYAKALGNLKELIKKEKSLTMTMPKYLGIIKVKPIESPHQAMRSDAEIERIGMEIAMKFEIKNGRTHEDVSSQNLGFDIRSIGRDGKIRYVEVKARAQSGDIALTQNEWFKAQRFKEDYYLYVVYDASKSPQLFIIQNPAERLRAQEKVEIVRFIIDGEDVIKTGEVVRH